MQSRKASFVVLALLASCFARAQFSIWNTATAKMYDPLLDSHNEVFTNPDEWQSAGRISHVSALSESHPWDPPVNIASAFSRFEQPEWEQATLRAQSFVISDYSAQGNAYGYEATAEFSLNQLLQVEVMGWEGGEVEFKAIVLMHGLMAAYGHYESGGGGIATARAESTVEARGAQGQLTDVSEGELTLVSADYNEYEWTATGDWELRVDDAYVDLPTGNEPRSANGVELSGYELVSFGDLPMAETSQVSVAFDLELESITSTPNGSFSLCDFSGTGGFQLVAFDQNGNPFHDFTVTAVPEPGTVALFSVGLAALARRRRR